MIVRAIQVGFREPFPVAQGPSQVVPGCAKNLSTPFPLTAECELHTHLK